MAAHTRTTHRRDRHEVRRVLAQLVVRGRDLTETISFGEIDFFHGTRRPANDNDVVLVSATRKRR